MPHVSGGGSHSGGYHSSSGGSRSFGGSHSSGYHSSSGGSRSFGGSHSSGYHSSSGGSRSFGGSHSGGYYSSSGGRSKGGFSGGSSYGSGARKHSGSRTVRGDTPIASTAYFDGAKRYVYYRGNNPHYVYSNFETIKPEFHFFRFLFWLFMLLGAFSVLKDDISGTNPAAVVPGPGKSAVVDSIGAIDDQDALLVSLEAFRNASGITPCVATLYHENWQNEFADLDTKALDFYVKAFQDEKHWVILYSRPTASDTSFVDWSWSSVQGDETDRLTTSLADFFGQTFQKYLMADSRYTVGEAMRLAFDALTEKMTPAPAEKDGMDIAIGIFMILLFVYIGGRRSGIIHKHLKRPEGVPQDAVPVGSDNSDRPKTTAVKEETDEKQKNRASSKPVADEIACEYCGAVFGRNTFKCPQCGAARKKKASE